MNKDITLEALIEEQQHRIPLLIYNDGILSYYSYADVINEQYIRWKEKAKRYLDINFPEDKHIAEFESLCNEKDLEPAQQQRLVAILEAFVEFPSIIKCVERTPRNGVNVNTTINNTNTQSQQQSQQQSIEILIKALEDQLSVSQLKEIKQVVEEAKGDLEKAKPKLIDKIKSFGENVASNILANIIANPAIWSMLS